MLFTAMGATKTIINMMMMEMCIPTLCMYIIYKLYLQMHFTIELKLPKQMKVQKKINLFIREGGIILELNYLEFSFHLPERRDS